MTPPLQMHSQDVLAVVLSVEDEGVPPLVLISEHGERYNEFSQNISDAGPSTQGRSIGGYWHQPKAPVQASVGVSLYGRPRPVPLDS